MYPLKTKQEMYFSYLNGIEETENEINDLEIQVRKLNRQIKEKKERVDGLKEMAEMYHPKKTVNIEEIVTTTLNIMGERLTKTEHHKLW